MRIARQSSKSYVRGMSIDPVPPLPPEVLVGLDHFLAKQPDIRCRSLAINMILMDWLIDKGHISWGTSQEKTADEKTGYGDTRGSSSDYC